MAHRVSTARGPQASRPRLEEKEVIIHFCTCLNFWVFPESSVPASPTRIIASDQNPAATGFKRGVHASATLILSPAQKKY